MKKLISLLLCIIIVFSLTSVFAEEATETSDKIEISFKVGDSTLLINGKEVTVETPYIAGEGTTLVPLRVITEAFGAEVLWDGETKTITLNYPDVTIILQIDNKEAKVNDHTEELSVAPTLSASGVTMVPLRFISETFGAEVGYNEGSITVTKSSDDFGTTVSTLTQKEKIGDSYYGWTMNTPKNLTLSDKSFDGRELSFENDDVALYFYVFPFDKNSSFEEIYISEKSDLSSYGSLTKDEIKKDENGNSYFIIQVNSKDCFYDSRSYYSENGIYTFHTYIYSKEASVKDSILAILDSFRIEEVGEDVYDLSEVKDGMRLYVNEDLKISLLVPADYSEYSEDATYFDLGYYGEEKEEVSSDIYLSETATAKSFAEFDHRTRKVYKNPKYSKLSEITEETVGDILFYKYVEETEGFKDNIYTTTDCFFEKGEYIYNITFVVEPKSTLDINAVLASLKVEELDPETVGMILRNENNPEMMVPIKNEHWSIKAPATWNPSNLGSEAQFSCDYSDAGIYISSSIPNKYYSDSQFRTMVKDALIELKDSTESTISKDMKPAKLNGYDGYTFSLKNGKKDEPTSYITIYYLYENNCIVLIVYAYSELYDTEETKNEINSILSKIGIETSLVALYFSRLPGEGISTFSTSCVFPFYFCGQTETLDLTRISAHSFHQIIGTPCTESICLLPGYAHNGIVIVYRIAEIQFHVAFIICILEVIHPASGIRIYIHDVSVQKIPRPAKWSGNGLTDYATFIINPCSILTYHNLLSTNSIVRIQISFFWIHSVFAQSGCRIIINFITIVHLTGIQHYSTVNGMGNIHTLNGTQLVLSGLAPWYGFAPVQIGSNGISFFVFLYLISLITAISRISQTLTNNAVTHPVYKLSVFCVANLVFVHPETVHTDFACRKSGTPKRVVFGKTHFQGTFVYRHHTIRCRF